MLWTAVIFQTLIYTYTYLETTIIYLSMLSSMIYEKFDSPCGYCLLFVVSATFYSIVFFAILFYFILFYSITDSFTSVYYLCVYLVYISNYPPVT